MKRHWHALLLILSGGWEQCSYHLVTKRRWNALMRQLEQERQHAAPVSRPCVGCWQHDHPGVPFPALSSSSLCPSCRASTLAQRAVAHVACS